MPNNSDEKPSPVSRGARTRRNWWEKAKDFIINDSQMVDTGDNTKLHISDSSYHIKFANIVLIGNQPTPGTSCAEHEGAQGSAQQSCRADIPVAQDSVGSRDEEPQVTLVQPTLALLTNNDASTLPSDAGNVSESEATAEYMDPDVPSISSKSYPHTSRARTDIYSFEMLTHRAGYPLYVPTPLGGLPKEYSKKGIRVGDVGMITAYGAFDFLFNTCQSDPGVNPDVLPDGFELLKPRIRTSSKFDPGICLTSDHIRKQSNGKNSDFQCLAAEGAVLALPKGATLYEATNKDHFENHAGRHAVSWYEYILNEGIKISNGSLYLVTECIKSANWGIAVFYAHPIPDENLRVILEEGSCQLVPGDKIDARVGPRPNDIIVLDGEEPNQCLFLRGYKIMLRPDIWGKLKGAMTVTSQDKEFSSSQSTRTTRHSPSQGKSAGQTDSFYQGSSDNNNTSNNSHVTRLASQLMPGQTLPGSPTEGANVSGPETSSGWLRQVILEENFREETPLHPSDLINLMLLHLKPEAKVALAHDSEWCDHLPHDFITDPVNPNVGGLLENIKRSCRAVINENGSAVLVNTEMESDAEPYLQHNLRRVSSATTSMRFNNSSSLLPTTKAMGHGSDDILSWTDQDPRESQLFNSWGVMYSFQTIVSTNGKSVTTLQRHIRSNKTDRVAKFEWATNGGLGRMIIGKDVLPMADMVRPDPIVEGARLFNGPGETVYRWTPRGSNSDIVLQDSNGAIIAFFRPIKRTRYQIGDVYWELHFLRNAGAGTVMHPPMMDRVTATAMLYRFCDMYNL